MNRAKEDLLLHPVRLRILLAIANRQMTARQLAKELPDIPQASLYRNLNILSEAGILSVVRERRVHNTNEKTYALPNINQYFTLDDLKNAGSEDYIRLFTQFLGSLLGYYVRYVQKDDINFSRDHVFFSMTPFYLSEAEIQAAGQAINEALQPYLKNEPSSERRRYILELLSLPDVSGASPNNNSRKD